MNAIYLKFFRGLRWNTLESIWYQVSLGAHQLILFSVVPIQAYGLIGTIFSSLYLIITFANLGMDGSLVTFFSYLSKSKQSFRHLILPQLIPDLLICFGIMGCLAFLKLSSSSLSPILFQLNNELLVVLSLLFLSEGIKKTLRTLLQLAFYNNATALIEIITISLYVGTVWTLYLCGQPITLELVFIPMLITSFMSTTALALTLYGWYNQLPPMHNEPLPPLAWRIIKNRFFNYTTQVSHAIFSGNFLVPFFAVHCGLAKAGIFKLINTVAYTLSCVLQKIFGLTTDALLAHVKPLQLSKKQDAFQLITHYLYPIVLSIICFVSLNVHKLITLMSSNSINNSITPIIVLFFAIHFSEYFFMVYEKFFIIEEKNIYVFIFNSITILAFSLLLLQMPTESPVIILTAILGIRIITFALMSSTAFYLWQLVPRSPLKARYLAFIFILSLLLSLY